MKILLHYFIFISTFLSSILAFGETINFPDSLEKEAYYFISNRNCAENKLAMYKARTNQSGISSCLIKGNFEVKGFAHMRKAEISVYNISNDQLVGVYNTHPKTGNYLIILVPNVKYEFVINTYGYAPIKKVVEIPSYASTDVYDDISTQKMLLTVDSTKVKLSLNTLIVEEKEPTIFLLTVYDESNENNHHVELYEANEETPDEQRKQLSETEFGNIDELLKSQAEAESKKPEQAEKAFLKKDFKTASEIYSELLLLDPDDELVNYRKGVSMFFTKQNKLLALQYLKKAQNSSLVPYDVHYYLGMTYHSWADFDKAQKAFTTYKLKAKPNEIATHNIERLIENCVNGKTIAQEQFDMQILNKTPIDKDKLTKELPSALTSEKLTYKTDFFISPIDSKKKEKLLMFKTEQNEMIQTSYGIDDKNGKDLFYNVLVGGDKWGISKTMGANINTSYNEDYAYVTLDGKTLYFASEGHNSIGGYDIFVSTRTTVNDEWSKPKNMGYPINSPYDDFMFMPSLSGNEAYFVSNRRSSTAGFNLFHINMPKPPLPLTIIKGHFMTNDSIPNFSASIAVYNTNNQEIVGIYNSNSNNGNFLMALMPGIKYEFEVMVDGFNQHLAYVTIPVQTEPFPLRQNIRLKKEGTFEILNIDNYFTKEEANNAPVYQYTLKDFEGEKAIKNEQKPNVIAQKFNQPSTVQKEILASAEQLFINKQYLKCVEQFEKVAPLIELTEKQSYYYGKSLFNVTKAYEKTLKYLEKAAEHKTTPYDVFFMLGKTNHNAYRFERAVTAFKKYEALANEKEKEKHNIEELINLSMFGKEIVNNPKPIEVLSKKEFAKNLIHTVYGSLDVDAKFLLAPDDMTTSKDKKEGFKPTMYLNKNKTVIYFASYGESGENGKDIFLMKKLPDNTWSAPINLGGAINSLGDEDFPFLTPDGKTLYFSSTQHGSMGGYDIFKSEWNEKLNTWGRPKNLGAPINSPFDDMFYVEE
ncbi:MAG: PD40 domain-containing protein [Flavobacteriales bacterium]|nr:PD40 domain-containing protein [Flavobacteriales bacterium]MCB9364305.1 PD40 domain-containing protein [Flavobacteriales bacterium]